MKCTYLLASVALASVTSAQVSIDWIATHDSPPGVGNSIRDVAVDATGRVAVGGTHVATPSLPIGGFEICLYEPDGTLAWSRSTHVNADEYCFAVAFDGTGGLFVAGGPWQTPTPLGSYRTLLHYDAVGNLLWSNTLHGTGWNRGVALALCPNGDVILAGDRNSDLSLERIDPAGNVLWSWSADGGNGESDYLVAVAVGPGGDVWATGTVRTSVGNDLVVVRVSSAGVPMWIRTFNGADHDGDYGSDLVVDAAGNTTVAGLIATPYVGGIGGPEAGIARWDSAGNLAWVRTYGVNPNTIDYASRIALDPFGRIVAGGSVHGGATGLDFAVWCHDTAGNLIWQGRWDGGPSDRIQDFVVDALGAAWVCGAIPETAASLEPRDLTIASWDSTGAFRWSWRYQGAGPGTSQSGYAAAVSGNSVIVAGSIGATPGAQLDALILKLNRTADEYCFGDGSSAPCPCANASAAEQHAGCTNSLGLGARLVDEGASSLAADTLVLAGSEMPNGDALYFQGTSSMSGGAGEPFGDGLHCVGGTLIRLGSSTNIAGASRFPDVGDPSVSTRGLVTTPGRRAYQTWYRDASVFCTTADFNFSNAILITWTL